MIIYGVLGEVSIGHLFIAGIVPGILLAVMLSVVPILLCTRNPNLGPPIGKVSWSVRFSSLKHIWPVAVVMLSILGDHLYRHRYADRGRRSGLCCDVAHCHDLLRSAVERPVSGSYRNRNYQRHDSFYDGRRMAVFLCHRKLRPGPMVSLILSCLLGCLHGW